METVKDVVCRSFRLVDEHGNTVLSMEVVHGGAHVVIGNHASLQVQLWADREQVAVELRAPDGRRLSATLGAAEGPHLGMFAAGGRPTFGMLGAEDAGAAFYRRDQHHALELGVDGAEAGLRIWNARDQLVHDLRA